MYREGKVYLNEKDTRYEEWQNCVEKQKREGNIEKRERERGFNIGIYGLLHK